MAVPIKSTVQQLDIGEEELLRALSAAEPTQHNEPGWFTVEEIVALSGLGATTVRRRLKAMITNDTVEYKNVVRTSLLGARYHCNAFKVKVK